MSPARADEENLFNQIGCCHRFGNGVTLGHRSEFKQSSPPLLWTSAGSSKFLQRGIFFCLGRDATRQEKQEKDPHDKPRSIFDTRQETKKCDRGHRTINFLAWHEETLLREIPICRVLFLVCVASTQDLGWRAATHNQDQQQFGRRVVGWRTFSRACAECRFQNPGTY